MTRKRDAGFTGHSRVKDDRVYRVIASKTAA